MFNTLITVSPTHIKFKDNNHNIIHLTKITPNQISATQGGVGATVTAPKGSVIEPLTMTPPRLNGTWNMTSNGAVNKTLGQINFETNNSFTGTFNGNKEHVSGTYSTLMGEQYADLHLDYTYQGHKVSVYGNLNVTDHDNMKMMNISVPSIYAKTGLYVHPGLIISFYRAPPIQFANSLIGHWTFTNQTSPAATAALTHGFTAKERNTTGVDVLRDPMKISFPLYDEDHTSPLVSNFHRMFPLFPSIA